MVPDDDPFADGNTPDPKDTNGADDKPTSESVTMDQAVEMVQRGIAPLAEQIGQLSEAQTALAAGIANPNPPPPVPPNGADPGEDFLTKFSTDPEGAVAGLVQQQVAGLTPVISTLMNSGNSAFVGLEAQGVDQEFGAGAWDKFFEKPMAQLMDSYRKSNVIGLADRSQIAREVNGLKGQQFDALEAYRIEARKTFSENEEGNRKTFLDEVSGQVRSNLTGGIRRIDTGAEEVTEGLKGYLAEREASIGEQNDPKEWLGRTDYGNTIEDYLAHQEKLKQADGKEKTT